MEKVAWEAMAKALELEMGVMPVERMELQERVLLKVGVKVEDFLLREQEDWSSPAAGVMESSLFLDCSSALEKHRA